MGVFLLGARFLLVSLYDNQKKVYFGILSKDEPPTWEGGT